MCVCVCECVCVCVRVPASLEVHLAQCITTRRAINISRFAKRDRKKKKMCKFNLCKSSIFKKSKLHRPIMLLYYRACVCVSVCVCVCVTRSALPYGT